MSAPGRLEVAADGRITGPAKIGYNDPFPTVNGNYGSGAMMGLLMHTMVGDLPGTTAWFNNPASQVSAHFGIAQSGELWQYGPVGKGWVAWHAAAGNLTWYGCEHADNGNPDNPLTPEQITASAQLVEVLSRFAGFPLQVTNSVDVKGYGIHAMGGAAFGGHTCPDLPPKHVRSEQRQAIVDLAKQIRTPPVPAGPNPVTAQPGQRWECDGSYDLSRLAADWKTTVTAIVAATLAAGTGAGVENMLTGALGGVKPFAGTFLVRPKA